MCGTSVRGVGTPSTRSTSSHIPTTDRSSCASGVSVHGGPLPVLPSTRLVPLLHGSGWREGANPGVRVEMKDCRVRVDRPTEEFLSVSSRTSVSHRTPTKTDGCRRVVGSVGPLTSYGSLPDDGGAV